MKILRICWAAALMALLASCSATQRGCDYKAHSQASHKASKAAQKKAIKARYDLTRFNCSR